MGIREAINRWNPVHLARQVDRLNDQVFQLKAQTRAKTQASGVDMIRGKYDYERTPELSGSKRWTTIEDMMTDPHVAASVHSKVLPLLQAEWTIEPASEDRKDQEIAEFVSANLLQQGGKKYGRKFWCQTPWRAQRLPEILDFLPHGFSMFHKTWRREGSKLVYDKLHYLEPESVDPYGWRIDEEDRLSEIWRTYRSPTGIYKVQDSIPAEELMLYVWGMKGARFDGRPDIRSLYGAWFRKDLLLRWSLLYAQKVAVGFPVIFYPDNWTDEDKDRAEEVVRAARGVDPELNYLVAPQGTNGDKADFHFAGSEVSEIDRLGTMIGRENSEMAHGGGTKSQQAGEQEFGTRSTAETHMTLEMLMVQAVGETVCEWETFGVGNLPGLIQELVDVNFSNVREYPRLTVAKVDPLESVNRAKLVADLLKMGALPNHPDLQRQVAKMVGLSLNEEIFEEAAEEREAMREAITGSDDSDSQEESADGEGASEDEQLEALSVDDVKRRIADLLQPIREGAPKGGGFRHMNRLESQYVALEAVQGSMDSADKAVLTQLRKARREMEADLMKRLRKGAISERNLGSQRRSRWTKNKKVAAITTETRETLRRVGGEGVGHISDELSRQQNGALEAFAVIDEARVAGRKVAQTVIGRFDTVVETTVQMMFDDLWERMLGSFLREWTRLNNQGLDDAALDRELEAFLQDLSDKPLEDMAREAGAIAYNFGRDAGLRTAAVAGLANYAVRSEILDGSTCEKCRVLDGYVAEIGSAQYDEFLPPAKCLGRGRCRGFYVVLARELVEAA